MDRWMDEWMDEWIMDRWVVGRMDRWIPSWYSQGVLAAEVTEEGNGQWRSVHQGESWRRGGGTSPEERGGGAPPQRREGSWGPASEIQGDPPENTTLTGQYRHPQCMSPVCVCVCVCVLAYLQDAKQLLLLVH